MNETLQTIKNRRSIRAFTSQPVKKEDIQSIIEAGLYAPSAGNFQPWHLTVLQNKEIIDGLAAETKNLIARDPKSPYQRFAQSEGFHLYHHAPVVIVVSGKSDAFYAPADCAAVTQNMLLAATSLGLGSCWINLVMVLLNSAEGPVWSSKLGIPAGYKPLYTLAIGYKQNENNAAPPRKTDCVNFVD